MSYRLKAGEAVPDAIRRIVCEEIDTAVNELKRTGKDRDEGLHEARKSVKKLRGVLRLMRPELGDVYQTENARARDLGGKLSEFRDAGAIIETLDGLREKYRKELGRMTLATIRRGLLRKKKEHEASANIEQSIVEVAEGLGQIRERVKEWPLQTDGFAAIAPGLKKTYSQGRKAMNAAHRRPRDEDYHEWRKRAKDHWYHIRLLENLWSDVLRAYESSLDDLQEWLGEDHNMVVLRAQLSAEPAFYGPRSTAVALGFMKKYQKELRANAKSLGERIYEEKPAQFAARMNGLWDAWQTQPKSLKKQIDQKVEAQEASAGASAPAA